MDPHGPSWTLMDPHEPHEDPHGPSLTLMDPNGPKHRVYEDAGDECDDSGEDAGEEAA